MSKPISRTAAVFIPVLIFCVIVRYLQLQTAIDFNTGFYSGEGIMPLLLYILFVVGFALIVLLSIVDKKNGNIFYKKKLGSIDKSEVKLLGILFFISASGALYSLFFDGHSGFWFLAAVLFFSGYILIGLVLMVRGRINTAAGFLMILPAVYHTIRAVLFFTSNYVLTKVSDYLIQLLICIFSTVFYLSLGKMFMRSESRLTRLRTAVAGYSALLLITSELVAKVVFLLTAPGSLQQDLSMQGTVFVMPDVLNTAECIIIFAVIKIMLKRRINSGE